MEQCEDKIKCQRRVELRASEIITCPRAQKGERGQPGQSFQNPESIFDQGQRDETKIDNEKEKTERMILSGGRQCRREKTAGNSEHGDDDRVQSNGEKKRDDGNQDHQQKCRNQSEEREVIIRSTCKSHRVEDENAGGTERLRGDGVFLSLQQYSADKQRHADDEANCNPHCRRNQIVLERIFDEKRHTEEKREPADPREKFCAHELLPIDWRSRWLRCFRRRRRVGNC